MGNFRHGHCTDGKQSLEYRVWRDLFTRCYNPKGTGYKYYGGRGITVCDRWSLFDNFLADMGPRPSLDYSIDRYPNKAGNYEPGNCRWATRKQQQRNTSTTVFIEFRGTKMALADAAEKYGIQKPALRYRLEHGWSLSDALTVPTGGVRP
jgi:hypothetical protein